MREAKNGRGKIEFLKKNVKYESNVGVQNQIFKKILIKSKTIQNHVFVRCL